MTLLTRSAPGLRGEHRGKKKNGDHKRHISTCTVLILALSAQQRCCLQQDFIKNIRHQLNLHRLKGSNWDWSYWELWLKLPPPAASMLVNQPVLELDRKKAVMP